MSSARKPRSAPPPLADLRALRDLASDGPDAAQALSRLALATSQDDWRRLASAANTWDKCRAMVDGLAKLLSLEEDLPALVSPVLDAALASQDVFAALEAQVQRAVNQARGPSQDDPTFARISRLVSASPLAGDRICLSILSALREMGHSGEDRHTKRLPDKGALEALEKLLSAGEPRDLRANEVLASYRSVEDYLSVHRTLFEEDFAEGLRRDLARIRDDPWQRDLEHLFAYGRAQVIGVERGKGGLVARLQLQRDVIDHESVDWESSKRLLDGSLLVLLSPPASRRGCPVATMTVVKEDGLRHDLRRGILRASLRSADMLEARGALLVFESRSYFEAYRYVSAALARLRDKLPMQEYFLDPEALPKRPNFVPEEVLGLASSFQSLNVSSKEEWSAEKVFYGLKAPKDKKQQQPNKKPESVLDIVTSRQMLNPSQLEAFKVSLQQEVGLVQGPPGTGKTHVGKMLLVAILENLKRSGKGPVLVVSQTNRCLDSLLESLLPVTKRIVRLGSRCTSPALDGHCLHSLRQYMRDGMARNSTLYKSEKALREARARLEAAADREIEGRRGVRPDAKRLVRLGMELGRAQARIADLQSLESADLLRGADVLGATATGAAKNKTLLEAASPTVMVLEEAGLALEAQVLAALPMSCRQLIMIGDHQQLRPSTNSYRLGKKFNLEMSFFERLIRSGYPCPSLREQHRMRPEISSVVSRLFYPNLEDHASVLEHPRVSGIAKSVFFLDHQFQESTSHLSKSRSNAFEAKFLLHLASHLLLQGYRDSDLTILTTYVGQQLRLRQEIDSNFSRLRSVQVQTVDNFQGEESRVVLLSLVRGGGDSIGFLSESNRLCVALSRAREGLYVAGNLETLAAKSEMWLRLREELEGRNMVGNALEICCFAHPGAIKRVSTPEDFDRAIREGCPKKCGAVLEPCGHACTFPCHLEDRRTHSGAFRCRDRCLRTCPRGHPCKGLCSDPCPPCQFVEEEAEALCGHLVRGVECGLLEFLESCGATCADLLRCGHPCGLPCHGQGGQHRQRCQERCPKSKLGCREEPGAHPCPRLCFQDCEPCLQPVDGRVLPCGHAGTKLLCSDDPALVECSRRCYRALECGHRCRNYCYECRQGGCDPCYRCN